MSCCSVTDRVFGCHLLTLCEREGTTVPKFVRICLEAVDKRGAFPPPSLLYVSIQLCCVLMLPVLVLSGLEADGIYRVSGNLATIQKLRFIIDEGQQHHGPSSRTSTDTKAL